MASEAAQSIPVARPKVRALQAVADIDGGVKLFRDNFWTLLTINCVIHVPVRLALAVAVWFLNSTMAELEELEMEVFFGAALATFAVASVLALVEPFLQGVVSYAAVERFMGREITVARAYRQALRRFWPLLLVGLVERAPQSVRPSWCGHNTVRAADGRQLQIRVLIGDQLASDTRKAHLLADQVLMITLLGVGSVDNPF